MHNPTINELLNVKYPIIMAPMFLVTNTKMMIEALNSKIAACIPALNFRTDQELRKAIQEIRRNTKSTGLGVNLIVNKSNIKLQKQLKTCIELKVDFIITSLGNPKQVIKLCQSNAIKVFCDVIDENYAKKVEKLGADAIVAVNKDAGGHAGNMNSKELISRIKAICSIPIISAGGVGTKAGVKEKINEGTNVLLEIELEGARQIRKSFPDALQIFLAPPSLSELETRIRGRGTESEEAIRDRLEIANKELIAKKEFDAVVINEDIYKAYKEIEGLMGLRSN